MSLGLSHETLKFVADILVKKQLSWEESSSKIKAIYEITKNPLLKDFSVPLPDGFDLDREIRNAELSLEIFKKIVREFHEIFPEFEKAYAVNMHVRKLQKEFDSANPWSVIERKKADELKAYTEENRYWIALKDPTGQMMNYDEYYKFWDEKNA